MKKQKKLKIEKQKTEYLEYAVFVVISVIVYLLVIQMFTGQYFWSRNVYNTYALQADSWRQGRLDLGQNYGHLEIAEYNGKFYCSFPPFPSYVLFPFTFLFGSKTPDGWILLIIDILAVVYLYKIASKLKLKPAAAALSTLFFFIGTNMAFDVFVPSVWFFAQTLSYALAVMSIYYALSAKGGWALFFWSCAVGCRPMQVLYLPVLLLILYQKEREVHPSEKWYILIKNKLQWAIPVMIIALSYMILNYARFDSITEFGHNYLPEFVNVHKQFSFEYLEKNFEMLMNLPEFSKEGKMVVDHFGNLNFLWVNPPILVTLLGVIWAVVKRDKKTIIFSLLILMMSVFYLLVTMMHATMGGWHFGNRYTNDVLPWMFLCLMPILSKNERLVKWQIPFAIWGLLFNVVGTVIVYNGLGR